MNGFKIEIYDNKTNAYDDYTAFAVVPFKYAELLDEQLDEAVVSLIRTKEPYFQPLTRVRVTLTNSPEAKFGSTQAAEIRERSDLGFTLKNGVYVSEDGRSTFTYSGGKITVTTVTEYVIASDRSVENIVGSGRFDHELYLIELTKIAEGFIGDSLTFTNALGNTYE